MCLVDELASRIEVLFIISEVGARQELPGSDARLEQL